MLLKRFILIISVATFGTSACKYDKKIVTQTEVSFKKVASYETLRNMLETK